MNISTKGRYGLRAMLDMAMNASGDPIPLSAVAQRQGISEGYLEQMMALLKRAGLVRSIRGAQGGYTLGRKPEEISVKDIFVCLEGPIAPVSCVDEQVADDCDRLEYCSTRVVWNEVKLAIARVLEQYTLADLIKMEAAHGGGSCCCCGKR
ncbi:MAG: Rrf2 family transcriptional regulator [Peptococcaceae bacterium]|jgi:Rrf2 family cysteine metabolism transcriptional repressor|nr:Rrf2 family transcriptional regulator [Peptococcaceae bacterium]